MKKLLLLLGSMLIIGGCENQPDNESKFTININDYAETVAFIADNFETESVPQRTSTEGYLRTYLEHRLSHFITIYTNGRNQVAYIEFNGISAEQVKTVLNEIRIPEDNADFNLMMDDPNEYERINKVRSLEYLSNDDIGIFLIALDQETAEALGYSDIYNLHVFYNLNVYEDFINE